MRVVCFSSELATDNLICRRVCQTGQIIQCWPSDDCCTKIENKVFCVARGWSVPDQGHSRANVPIGLGVLRDVIRGPARQQSKVSGTPAREKWGRLGLCVGALDGERPETRLRLRQRLASLGFGLTTTVAARNRAKPWTRGGGAGAYEYAVIVHWMEVCLVFFSSEAVR